MIQPRPTLLQRHPELLLYIDYSLWIKSEVVTKH